MTEPGRSALLLLTLSLAVILNNVSEARINIGGAKECDKAEGPVTGSVVDLRLSGCEDGMTVCPLIRGESSKINLTFTSKVDVPNLRVALHGLVLGFPVPFHLSNEDACTNSNLVCPVKANQSQSYLAKVPVKPYYPSMPITVKIQLTDPDKGVDVVCQYIQTKLI